MKKVFINFIQCLCTTEVRCGTVAFTIHSGSIRIKAKLLQRDNDAPNASKNTAVAIPLELRFPLIT